MCWGLGKWHLWEDTDWEAKAAGVLVPFWVSVFILGWGREKGGTVQRSDSSTVKQLLSTEPEGVCCLDIFVKFLLEREILTAHSLWKGKLPKFKYFGGEWWEQPVCKHNICFTEYLERHILVFKIAVKFTNYVIQRINTRVEWKAEISHNGERTRDHSAQKEPYRREMLNPKAEGTVKGSLISWAFPLEKGTHFKLDSSYTEDPGSWPMGSIFPIFSCSRNHSYRELSQIVIFSKFWISGLQINGFLW